MPGVINIGELLNGLGQDTAAWDAQANRARTDSTDRLRQLAAMGLQRKEGLNDNFATQGTVHSGAALKAHTQLGQEMDSYRAQENQGLNDKLADIARKKLTAETQFNIQSLLPR